MNVSDEKLVAFMDGEMSELEMTAIADAIAASPELVQRLELLGGADEKIRQRFAALDARPIRADTLELINNAAYTASTEHENASENIVAFKAKPRMNMGGTSNIWMRQAIAATIALAVGFGGGAFVFPGAEQTNTSNNGAVYQTAGLVDTESPLFSVLETGQSATAVELAGHRGVSATPVSTFQTHGKGFCREFELDTNDSKSRNIACRNGGAWTIIASVLDHKGPVTADGSFITASDSAPQLLDIMILQLIDGDIIGKEDEAKLLGKSWK